MTSSERERPPDAVSVVSESGYGTANPSQHDPQESRSVYDLSSPNLAPSLSRHPSQQGDYTLFGVASDGHFDELAGIGQGQVADPSVDSRESDTGFYQSSRHGGDGLTVLSTVAANVQLASPADSVMRTPSQQYGSLPNLPSLYVSQCSSSGPQQGSIDHMVWTDQSSCGTKRVRSSNMPEGQPTKHPDGDLICPECNKRKKRDCDLKCVQRHRLLYIS